MTAASRELLALWEEVEALLRTARDGIHIDAEGTRAQIEEYLDHKELGLAAELIRYALEAGCSITPAGLTALSAAEAKMEAPAL